MSYKAARKLANEDAADLAPARYVALTPRNGKYATDIAVERERFEDDFLSVTAGCSPGNRKIGQNLHCVASTQPGRQQFKASKPGESQ